MQMSFLPKRNQSTWRKLSMKTINAFLHHILSGSIFIMLSPSFGNHHIFPENQVISEVNIASFPGNHIQTSGLHSGMSFSDDGKHFAVWNDEYAEIYDLGFKDAKPIQQLFLVENSPWRKFYQRGRSEKVITHTTGNISLTGPAAKYMPLLCSSSIFPENFGKLKSYIDENKKLMKRYDFLLQKEALSIIILGGYKIAPHGRPFLLGSIDFKPIIFLEQAVSPYKSSKGGNAFESMLSSDMTKACISYPAVASFSFYEGQTKVMEITPESLGLEKKSWTKSTPSMSDDGALLVVGFTYTGRFVAPWNFKTAIAFIDTANRKVTGTRVLSGAHQFTFCFSNDKSKVALWESGKKTIHIFNFQ